MRFCKMARGGSDGNTVMWVDRWSELYILGGQSIISLTANLAACPCWSSVPVGGFAKSRIRKLSFVKFQFLSYTASKSAFNKGAWYAVLAKHTSVDLVMKSAMAFTFTFTLWLWRRRNGHFTCSPMPPYMPDRGGGGIIRVGGFLPWLPRSNNNLTKGCLLCWI